MSTGALGEAPVDNACFLSNPDDDDDYDDDDDDDDNDDDDHDDTHCQHVLRARHLLTMRAFKQS